MYSEKENFNRVLDRKDPSHVCYPPPSKGAAYRGAWPTDSRPDPDAVEWRDEWGVLWREANGEAFPVEGAVASYEAVEEVCAPDPNEPVRLQPLEELVVGLDRERCFLGVNHPYFLYEKSINILGPDEFGVAMLAAPRKLEALLDTVVEFERGIADRYIRFEPDHVNFSDDYGHQDRLAMSPDCWRRFFKPRLAEMVAHYRQGLGADITISLHCCGHVMPILEDIMEAGIDVWHPVQSTANDLDRARRVTSGRLTLAGGIDGQRILPLGTPQQVREEVFHKLDLLWENGGYLPMAEKTHGVPEENVQAMEKAIRQWSRRNVET